MFTGHLGLCQGRMEQGAGDPAKRLGFEQCCCWVTAPFIPAINITTTSIHTLAIITTTAKTIPTVFQKRPRNTIELNGASQEKFTVCPVGVEGRAIHLIKLH